MSADSKAGFEAMERAAKLAVTWREAIAVAERTPAPARRHGAARDAPSR